MQADFNRQDEETLMEKEVRKIWFERHVDSRGDLCVIKNACLPFEVKRMFWIDDLPFACTRGGHAHKECEQVIIPVSGGAQITVNDKTTYALYPWSNVALYVPPMNKVDFFGINDHATILVLCSHEYDPEDYLYD